MKMREMGKVNGDGRRRAVSVSNYSKRISSDSIEREKNSPSPLAG